MSQKQNPGFFFRNLEKCRSIKTERFADLGLCIFNAAVDFVGGKIDEKCGNFGQKRLEPQLTFEF